MAISKLTNTVRDPGLGSTPANTGKTQVKIGVCQKATPLTLYTAGGINPMVDQLGSGPLSDCGGQVLDVAGGPCLFVALTPSTFGAVSASFTLTGTGPGTIAGSKGPEKVVKVKIVTGGVLATMTFKVAIGTGAYGATITSGADPYTYQVPGQMFTKLAFATGTYVANDVYTLNLDGTVSRTGTGPATALDGSTHSPVDTFEPWILITGSGALGVATFRYSLDGGNNYSTDIQVPAGGKYAIPGSGIVLTFASTFTVGDLYVGTASAASFSNSDVTAAFTYLLSQPNTWSLVHIVGTPANVAAAVTLEGVVDVQVQAYAAAKRYVRAFVEVPADEGDSTIATAIAAVTSDEGRTSGVVGDCRIQSRVTGRKQKRHAAWAYTARLSATKLCSHPGQVRTTNGGGKLKNVTSIYRDEEATPALDAARLVTLRQVSEKPGGYYVTDGMTLAPAGSDYQWIYNGRVMDRMRVVTNAVAIESLNADLRADENGHIDERDAQDIEDDIMAALRIALYDEDEVSQPPRAVVDRTNAFLSTAKVNIEVTAIPKGYAKEISITMSFENPAFRAAAA